MLDERRRDDIGWLIATYDQLVDQATSEQREEELALVQRWLRRVTGMPTISAALDAARRLTRHGSAFVAAVVPEQARPGDRQPGARRSGRRRVVPALTDETAAELERLLAELDGSSRDRRPTAAERAQAERVRQRIHELTGFVSIVAAQHALNSYVTRRDGVRKFIPTKSYAEGPGRKPPRITVVGGGSPGGGRR